ncbi:MAG: hypothetical protein CL484_12200 [Acidobacteria bacterium]|nr:hypothetical protein [Acidobacteriota bacterium]|tara:strand:- start:766 stop:1722 length:957 start_codon:yes stop_codon:yes gene_type:complete
MLTIETRKRLHEIGWTRIRQSHIRLAQECGEKLVFTLQGFEPPASAYALLGSVFHDAVENMEDLLTRGMHRQFWSDTMYRVKGDRDYTLRGQLMGAWDYETLIDDLHSGKYVGMRAYDLAMIVKSSIMMHGITVVYRELALEYTVGTQYPITFVGTADIVGASGMGNYILLDLKTSGLWGALINRKSDIKAQRWSAEQLTHHRQLRHYAWMLHKQKGITIGRYGLINPANAVPYKRGSKEGQARGDVIAMSNPLVHHLDQYEHDLARWVTAFSMPGGLGRDYPEVFGKPACPHCKYFSSCVGATPLTQVDADFASQYS